MIRELLNRGRKWDPNPVLLKELRQAVRNRTLTSALLFLLAALFLVCVAFLTRQQIALGQDHQLGLRVFRALLVILAVATFVFVPLYVGGRLAAERREHHLDLMFITALSARRIVSGKLFSGAYVAAWFFSACMPFMLFTNLLRGVDIPTVLVLSVSLFSAVCLAIQAAIFLACLPLHLIAKTFAGILFALGLTVVCGGLIALFFNVLRSGVGTLAGEPTAWIGFVTVVLLIAGGIRLLHSMSVSLIIADNRPRGYYNEIIRESAP